MLWRNSPVNKWRRFRRLAAPERYLLVQALVLLPISALVLRLAGFRRVQEWFTKQAGGDSARSAVAGAADLEQARAVARSVAAASREGFCRGTCLSRSLVLCWLLRRCGIPAELRIGVRKKQDGLDAHAWVECAGKVLNEDDRVSLNYAAFQGDLATLPERPR